MIDRYITLSGDFRRSLRPAYEGSSHWPALSLYTCISTISDAVNGQRENTYYDDRLALLSFPLPVIPAAIA